MYPWIMDYADKADSTKSNRTYKNAIYLRLNTVYGVIFTLVYFHEFFKNWMFAFKFSRTHVFLPEVSI